MKPNPHPVPSSVRKKFLDNFLRPDTTSDLGITDTGSRWDLIRGAFRIFQGSAISDDPPSEYPLASVTMPYEDVDIDLYQVDNGSAAALWVTGSGDWWAAGLDQEAVDCNCDTATECDAWNSKNCARRNNANCRREECVRYSGSNRRNCAAWAPINYVFVCYNWRINYIYGDRTCSGGSELPQSGGGCVSYPWNSNNCEDYDCVRWNNTNCIAYNSNNCRQWFEYAFNCETCYPQYIRIIQSVANSVSTIFSKVISPTFRTVLSPNGNLSLFEQDNKNDPTASSMKIKTLGSNVEIEVFEGDFQTDKINVGEQITYDATGAEITPTYGIMIKPSDYNQNNIIGEIDIDKNF